MNKIRNDCIVNKSNIIFKVHLLNIFTWKGIDRFFSLQESIHNYLTR